MHRKFGTEVLKYRERKCDMGFITHIKEEFQVIQERDPAIKTPLEVLLYPSFRVMIQYRKAHKLYEKGHYFLARWISQLSLIHI